ncbi:hypothetical protein ACM66B_001900 [Microbotryomycetes sp. NB124-2]
MHVWPREVVQLVIQHVDQADLCRLRRVSRAFNAAARDRLFREVVVSRPAQVDALLQLWTTDSKLKNVTTSVECRSRQHSTAITSSQQQLSASRKSKRPERTSHELTEHDVVRLLSHTPRLLHLVFSQLEFTSLRRRSLSDLATRVSLLQSLVICGRKTGSIPHADRARIKNGTDGRFSLTTVGQIVSLCHRLKSLHLEAIAIHRSSLHGISRPTFRLVHLSLLDCPGLEATHFEWILASTCHAESLRSWTLEYDGRGRELHNIWYTGIRVERLCLKTRTPRVAESFALHCESLRWLELDTPVSVDATILFRNTSKGLLVYKQRGSGGVNLMELAALLDMKVIRILQSLKRLELDKSVVSKKELKVLRSVCSRLKIFVA